MHKVIVSIRPDGTTEVKVDGVAGGKCKDVTRALEGALGKTTADKATDDMYKTEAQIQQRQGMGG